MSNGPDGGSTRGLSSREKWSCSYIAVPYMCAWHHEDELLCWINDTEYGLAAYIYTGRLQDAMRIGESIDAGMVGTCSWRSGFCDAVWSAVRWWQPHGPHRRPSRLRPRIAEPRPRCPRRSADH